MECEIDDSEDLKMNKDDFNRIFGIEQERKEEIDYGQWSEK